jgi:hypothetical protein
MIKKTVAALSEEDKRILREEVPTPKYQLVHLDFLDKSQKIERNQFRLGLAQIGLSETGNILQELYEETGPGLFKLREDKLEIVKTTVEKIVHQAASDGIDLLLFPELTIDLYHAQLLEDILHLSQTYKIHIVPGSYHDPTTQKNLCMVISPKGILWEQEKHIPAIIHFQ